MCVCVYVVRNWLFLPNTACVCVCMCVFAYCKELIICTAHSVCPVRDSLMQQSLYCKGLTICTIKHSVCNVRD